MNNRTSQRPAGNVLFRFGRTLVLASVVQVIAAMASAQVVVEPNDGHEQMVCFAEPCPDAEDCGGPAGGGGPGGGGAGGPGGGGGGTDGFGGGGGGSGDSGGDLSDPVEFRDGTFRLTQTDLFVPGLGLNFNLTRTYLSKGGHADRSGYYQPNINNTGYSQPLGRNWDHSFNLRATFDPVFNLINFSDGTGRIRSFYRYNNEQDYADMEFAHGSFAGIFKPDSVNHRLVLLTADGTQYHFFGENVSVEGKPSGGASRRLSIVTTTRCSSSTRCTRSQEVAILV